MSRATTGGAPHRARASTYLLARSGNFTAQAPAPQVSEQLLSDAELAAGMRTPAGA